MTLNLDFLKPYAGVFLRLALGVIFVYHGWPKVFGEGSGLGTSWNPADMNVMLQILVSWGELLGGIAFLAGFLTDYAAIGIIVIMAGAVITVHGENGFGMANGGFEYNFVIICMCLSLMATGPGRWTVQLRK